MNKFSNNIIYVLDFDGVICDSIDECMLVSYNSFNDTNFINIRNANLNIKKINHKFRIIQYK